MALPGTNVLLLSVLLTLAALVGLIMWGVSLFEAKSANIARLDAPKIAVSCIASAVATFLVVLGLMPSLMQGVSSLNLVAQGLIFLIASVGIPILVLAGCLAIVGNLRSKEANALALFGQGGFTLAAAIGLLALAADITTAINSVPSGLDAGLSNVENIKTGLWAMLFIGAALLFAGYQMGMNLMPVEPPQPPSPPQPPLPSQPSLPPQLLLSPLTESGKQTVVGGPQPSANSSWMVIKDGSRKGQQFSVSNGDLKIGRASSCPIRLENDDEVSREHALIRSHNGSCQLHDLASINGTFLNGQRIGEARTLMDDDEVRVGKTTLVYKKVG